MNQFGHKDLYGFNLLNDPLLKTTTKNYDFKYIKPDEFDRVIKAVEHNRLNQSKKSVWQEFCDKCDKRTIMEARSRQSNSIPEATAEVTEKKKHKKSKKRSEALIQNKSIFSKLSLPPKESPKIELPKVRVMSETEIDAIISKAIADVMSTGKFPNDLSTEQFSIQSPAVKEYNEDTPVIDTTKIESETKRTSRSIKSNKNIDSCGSLNSLATSVSLKSLSLTSMDGSNDTNSKCSFDEVSAKYNEGLLNSEDNLSKETESDPLEVVQTISESARSKSTKLESSSSKTTQLESSRSKTTKPESTRSKSTKPELAKHESAKPESEKPDSAKPESAKAELIKRESEKSIKSLKTTQSSKSEHSLNELKLEESENLFSIESRQESVEFDYNNFITPSEIDQLKKLKYHEEKTSENNQNDFEPKTKLSKSTLSSKETESYLSSFAQSSNPDIKASSNTEQNNYNKDDNQESVESDDLHIALDSNDSTSESDDISETEEKLKIESMEKRVNSLVMLVSKRKSNSSQSEKSANSNNSLNLSNLEISNGSSKLKTSSEKSKKLEKMTTTSSSKSDKSISSKKSNQFENLRSSDDTGTSSTESLYSDLSGKRTAQKNFKKEKFKLENAKKKEKEKQIEKEKRKQRQKQKLKTTPKNPNKLDSPIVTPKTKSQEKTDPKKTLSIPRMSFLTESENEEMKRLLGFSVNIPEISFDKLNLDYEKQRKSILLSSTQSESDSDKDVDSENDESDYYAEDKSVQNNMIPIVIPKTINSNNSEKNVVTNLETPSEMPLETGKQSFSKQLKSPKTKSAQKESARIKSTDDRLAIIRDNVKKNMPNSPQSVDTYRQSGRVCNSTQRSKNISNTARTDKSDNTDRSSFLSPFNDEKRMIFSKITSYHKKIIETLDNLRASVLQLSMPDGCTEKKRREKKTMEFTVRFARNFLYPLERMIEEIRITHSDDFTSKYTNIPCSKICGIYALIQQALSSYDKQIRHFILNNNAKKLNVLIKLIISCTDICCRKNIFHQNDELLMCLVERCHSFLQFLKDVQSPQKSSRFEIEAKPSKKKALSSKHSNETNRKLNMYEGAVTPNKPKRKQTGRKLINSMNTARLENQMRHNFKNNFKNVTTEDLKSSPSYYTEPESFITPRPDIDTHIEKMTKSKADLKTSDEFLTCRHTNRSESAEESVCESTDQTESKSEITKRAVMEVVQSIAIEEVRNLLAPFVSNLGSMFNQTNDIKGLELALKNLNSLSPTNNDDSKGRIIKKKTALRTEPTNMVSVKKKRTNFTNTNTNEIVTPRAKNKLSPQEPILSPSPKRSTSSLIDDEIVIDEKRKPKSHRTSPTGDGLSNRLFETIYYDQNMHSINSGEGEGEGVALKNKSSNDENNMKKLNYHSNIQFAFIKSEEDSEESEEKNNETIDEDDEDDDINPDDLNLDLNGEASKESVQSVDDYYGFSNRSESNTELEQSLQGIFQDRCNFIERTEKNPLYCNERFEEPWKLLTKMTRKLTNEILNQTDLSAAFSQENYLEKLIRMELDLK